MKWKIVFAALCVIIFAACPLTQTTDILEEGDDTPADAVLPEMEPEPPAPEAPADDDSSETGFRIYNDIARNQAVLIAEDGTWIDIGTEENGEFIPCTFAEDHALRVTTNGGDLKALVVGKRGDGRPGIWEVHDDNSIHPVVASGVETETSRLFESPEREEALTEWFGWTYNVTDVSEDGKIIVGYAEHEEGYTFGRYSIAPGTTVGVYWGVVNFGDGRVERISRAKIIGISEHPGFAGNRGKGRQFWQWFLKQILAKLRLFFHGWMDAYFVRADSVESDSVEGQYRIKGTDQDGDAAIALVTALKVLSIEKDAGNENQAPEVTFPAGDYQVSGAGTGAADGFYEENGTLNGAPLFVQLGGSYSIFYSFFSGHPFPPPQGYFWNIGADTSATQLSDVAYYRYGIADLPGESGWAESTGAAPVPEVKRIPFSGDLAVGSLMTMYYIYTDPDGDAEDTAATRIRWFRCASPDASVYDGSVSDEIAGAAGTTYTTVEADRGSYLKVEIIPFDVRGAEGEPAVSGASRQIGS